MPKADAPNTNSKFGRVSPADFEKIRRAFRAPLNRKRSLKEAPSKVLERLLDERITIDGKKKTKREVIIANLIHLVGSGDRAASKLLHQFLARQNEQRFEEQMATSYVDMKVLAHVVENLDDK